MPCILVLASCHPATTCHVYSCQHRVTQPLHAMCTRVSNVSPSHYMPCVLVSASCHPATTCHVYSCQQRVTEPLHAMCTRVSNVSPSHYMPCVLVLASCHPATTCHVYSCQHRVTQPLHAMCTRVSNVSPSHYMPCVLVSATCHLATTCHVKLYLHMDCEERKCHMSLLLTHLHYHSTMSNLNMERRYCNKAYLQIVMSDKYYCILPFVNNIKVSSSLILELICTPSFIFV